MPLKPTKDIDLLTWDCIAQAWRKITKGELSGKPTVVSKAADYTIPATVASGTTFIATAAAVFTLPAPADKTGATYTFVNAADATMGVKTATADTLITDGDLTADSVEFSTAGHKIGGRVQLWCDGTSWYAFNASGCTMTVNT